MYVKRDLFIKKNFSYYTFYYIFIVFKIFITKLNVLVFRILTFLYNMQFNIKETVLTSVSGADISAFF